MKQQQKSLLSTRIHVHSHSFWWTTPHCLLPKTSGALSERIVYCKKGFSTTHKRAMENLIKPIFDGALLKGVMMMMLILLYIYINIKRDGSSMFVIYGMLSRCHYFHSMNLLDTIHGEQAPFADVLFWRKLIELNTRKRTCELAFITPISSKGHLSIWCEKGFILMWKRLLLAANQHYGLM